MTIARYCRGCGDRIEPNHPLARFSDYCPVPLCQSSARGPLVTDENFDAAVSGKDQLVMMLQEDLRSPHVGEEDKRRLARILEETTRLHFEHSTLLLAERRKSVLLGWGFRLSLRDSLETSSASGPGPTEPSPRALEKMGMSSTYGKMGMSQDKGDIAYQDEGSVFFRRARNPYEPSIIGMIVVGRLVHKGKRGTVEACVNRLFCVRFEDVGLVVALKREDFELVDLGTIADEATSKKQPTRLVSGLRVKVRAPGGRTDGETVVLLRPTGTHGWVVRSSVGPETFCNERLEASIEKEPRKARLGDSVRIERPGMCLHGQEGVLVKIKESSDHALNRNGALSWIQNLVDFLVVLERPTSTKPGDALSRGIRARVFAPGNEITENQVILLRKTHAEWWVVRGPAGCEYEFHEKCLVPLEETPRTPKVGDRVRIEYEGSLRGTEGVLLLRPSDSNYDIKTDSGGLILIMRGDEHKFVVVP